MIKFEKWKHEEFLGESEPEVSIMKYSDSGFFLIFRGDYREILSWAVWHTCKDSATFHHPHRIQMSNLANFLAYKTGAQVGIPKRVL